MTNAVMRKFGFFMGGASGRRARLARAVRVLAKKAGDEGIVKEAWGWGTAAKVLGGAALGGLGGLGALRLLGGRDPWRKMKGGIIRALGGQVPQAQGLTPEQTQWFRSQGLDPSRYRSGDAAAQPAAKKALPVYTPEDIRESRFWTGVSPEQAYGQWRAMLGTQRRLQRLAELSKGYSQAFRM